MMSRGSSFQWLSLTLIFLSLGLGILGCGCLSSTAGENTINIKILEKNLSPSELGECTYRTRMAVTNNGTVDIHTLSIIIEIYDPGAQKIAARESLSVNELRSGETRNAISILQTHCRMNYTLRAYAQY